MPTGDEILAKYRKRQRATLAVVIGSFVAIVGLVITFAIIFNSTRPEPQQASAPTYDSYQAAWESAMAKASVEATFPGSPVALADLRTTGTHAFSATFTDEEISALLAMHPFAFTYADGTISLLSPSIAFPAEDTGSFDGRLVYGGDRYRAKATAPVTFARGEIVVNTAGSELTVEGFSVGGDRRDQALRVVQDYLNGLLAAAPGLNVRSARIVDGGLDVEGMAPDSLSYPAQTTSTD